MREMPESFRFKLDCKDCNAGLEGDGHFSMACIDAYLASHIEAFGHTRYNLEIIIRKPAKVKMDDIYNLAAAVSV